MSTMIELFKAAGFEYPEAMAVDHRHEVTKKISIKAYDTEKREVSWQPVKALYFKGLSDPNDTFRVSGPTGSFLCTGQHAIYDADSNNYKVVRAFTSGIAKVISSTGEVVKAKIEKVAESFSILDAEVEGTSNYFSAGILSHNSFGGSAKLMSEALRKFNPLLEKYKTSMFMISQERDNIGSNGYGPDYKVTGGRAIKFYASNRSRVQRVDYIKEKGIITGIQMRVKNEKNKAGIPYREAMLTLDFEKGFDINNEYMDFIISLGIAEQKGAWFYMPQYGLEKANGRDAVQAWLNLHPEEYAKVKLEVNTQLTGETILDQDNAPVADDDFDEPPEIIPDTPESISLE